MQQFAPHGKCKLSIEGSILIADVEGPWNIEFVHLLHEQLVDKVKELNVNNYGVLLIPRGEALASQEAIDCHTNFLKQVKAKAVAINLTDSLVPIISKNMYEKIYQSVNLTAEFFDDNVSAKKWLAQQLTLNE